MEANLPAIRADGPLLRSVIINLIDNAAEALEDATVREITVATHLRPESDTIEIAVADTGHGISPEDKDKLFLPHFSTKDRGTGLGLAIAARIISEHGGSLRVEDNRPVGSRFLDRIARCRTVRHRRHRANWERTPIDDRPSENPDRG